MKKSFFMLLLLVILSLIITPFKVNAATTNMTCYYDITIDNSTKILSYEVLSDGNINLAFLDGTDVLNNSLNWYHDINFKNDFLLAVNETKKKATCPTLTLEKKNRKVKVYSRILDVNNCKGACTKIESKKIITGKSIIVDGIIKTSAINSYLSALNDSNNTAVNNNNVSKGLGNNIIRSIFKSGKTSILDSTLNTKILNTSVINNISQIQKKYKDEENLNCTDSDDSLLGDPNNEDSVAWLIQKVLNYIKIIGPILVIIFSSIDYLRALIQSDNETLAKLNKKLITRIVLVLLLFFVPTIVNALLALIGFTNTSTCNLE